VFRYFPLREIHPHAEMAAEAAETVYALGGPEVFWVMHDALFANQDDLEAPSLERQATGAGVASKPFALRSRHTSSPSAYSETFGAAWRVVWRHAVRLHQWERYVGERDVDTLREVLSNGAR